MIHDRDGRSSAHQPIRRQSHCASAQPEQTNQGQGDGILDDEERSFFWSSLNVEHVSKKLQGNLALFLVFVLYIDSITLWISDENIWSLTAKVLSTSSSQLISIAVVYGTPSYKWKRIFGSGAIRNEEKVPSAELKQQEFKKLIKTQKREEKKEELSRQLEQRQKYQTKRADRQSFKVKWKVFRSVASKGCKL